MAWFTATDSGATCVAAYDAIGAASLADSYVNEANPGTYNAAPGVAPTWAYGTGWTFNGTTQWLDTGVTPSSLSWSVVVRYSGKAAGGQYGACSAGSSASSWVGVYPSWDSNRLWANGTFKFATPNANSASGVMAVAGSTGYFDGALSVTGIAAGSGVPAASFRIGKGQLGFGTTYNIQAAAIYSGTLTLADVVAITAAMSALPTAAAAALGLPVIAHHHRQVWG